MKTSAAADGKMAQPIYPANLSTLRRTAQSLIRKEASKGSIRIERKRAGWDDEFMQAVLATP